MGNINQTMNLKPDGERIAMLEVHMVDQDKKLDQIVADIKDIKTTLSLQADLRVELNNAFERIRKLENPSPMVTWLKTILLAVGSSILTILVLSYLDKLK